MTVLLGFSYALYFIILGYGIRATYNWLTHRQLMIEKKTDFFAHAFFQGVFFHVILFNLLQLLNLSNTTVLLIVLAVLLACLVVIIRHIYHHGLQGQTMVPELQNAIISGALVLFSAFIYWNGSLLPNIAWDSWAVWEGKAQQWVYHGLNADIMQWSEWIKQENAIFNPSANYPDGLSLIYFLPKILLEDGFAVTQIVVLFAYAMMTLLLINRLAKIGAPGYLQVVMVAVIYTTPFISNHLMIQGYADLWLAMYILLIMLSLMDYIDDGQVGVGLAVVCYLLMLPMLKLEGWVWLLLFLLSYLLILLSNHRHRHKIYLAVAGLLVILILLGGVSMSFPVGDLVITAERITFFNLFDIPVKFVNISDALLVGFLWQNNWSLLWLGLPFLIFTFFNKSHSRASQVAHVFLILALLCFLWLFYFTEASQWAQDLTAINRVVLQLTPCYLFLLFKMLISIKGIQTTSVPEQQP